MITTDELFKEDFEPLWMQWDRESRTRTIKVRFRNPTYRIIFKKPRGILPTEPGKRWHPKLNVPISIDAIPYRGKFST